MKVWRVFSRDASAVEGLDPAPSDLQRRKRLNVDFIENGISVLCAESMTASEAIDMVRRKTNRPRIYGVLYAESDDLVELGYHMQIDNAHVNLRCPPCDCTGSPKPPPFCKPKHTAHCQFDNIEHSEKLSKVFPLFRLEIPISPNGQS